MSYEVGARVETLHSFSYGAYGGGAIRVGERGTITKVSGKRSACDVKFDNGDTLVVPFVWLKAVSVVDEIAGLA